MNFDNLELLIQSVLIDYEVDIPKEKNQEIFYEIRKKYEEKRKYLEMSKN